MSAESQTLSLRDISRMIDHSMLHPTMTDQVLHEGAETAREQNCASACVKPYAVPMAAEILKGSETVVCAVTGFPHGNSHVDLKVAETERAIAEGAVEIDTVVNIGKVLGGDWDYVTDELDRINQACVKSGAILKVIFENDYLSDDRIIRLCQICTELRIAFVKTSSGYGFVKQPSGDYNYKGATDHHLKLMREHSGPEVQVKAAGGVRTLDDLLRVRALGVTRSGATATVAIIEEARTRGYK